MASAAATNILAPGPMVPVNPWGALMAQGQPSAFNPYAPMPIVAPTQSSIDQSADRGPSSMPAAPSSNYSPSPSSPYAAQANKTKMDNQGYIDAASALTPMKEQAARLGNLDALNAGVMAAVPNEVDLSPILGLIDSYTGSKLSNSYAKPVTAQQRAQMVMGAASETQKGHQALLQSVLGEGKNLEQDALAEQAKNTQLTEAGYMRDANGNITIDPNGVEAAKIKDFASQARLRDAQASFYGGGQGAGGAGGMPPIGSKQWNALTKEQAALQKDIDPNGARAGNFGLPGRKLMLAQDLEGLKQAGGDMSNLTPPQQEELAIGLQAMLSGGGSSVAQVQGLVPPQTLASGAQGIKTWLLNEPLGANQQAFVKNMFDTVEREKGINQGIVRTIQKQRLGSHQLYAQADPVRYASQLAAFGLDKDGNALPLPGAAAGAGAAPASAGAVQMKAPDGKIRMVPADQVEAAKAAGGSLL